MHPFPTILPAPVVVTLLGAVLVANGVHGAETTQNLSADTSRIDLQSDYIPAAVRVPTTDGLLQVRSVRIQGKLTAGGAGEGSVLFDPRPATLDAFGDAVERQGPPPAQIPVKLRRLSPQEILNISAAPRGFGEAPPTALWPHLYQLEFPGRGLIGTVHLKLGTAGSGPHRLLFYAATPAADRRLDSGAPQVLTLTGEPRVPLLLGDKPWSQKLHLYGSYNASDGSYRSLRLEGKLGAQGRLSLDPNYISVDPFGEPGMTTLMGFRPEPVNIMPVEAVDPSGLGRQLYRVLSDNPRNTNRCTLVLGRTEAAAHRLLLHKGDSVQLIVPVVEPDRQRQEAAQAEMQGVTAPERQAIATLREIIGYDFTCEIADGKIRRLNITSEAEMSSIDGALAGLENLKDLYLQGKLSPPGLPSLAKAPGLASLGFSGASMQPGALAFLQNLEHLESLSFYMCEGIDDTALPYMSGLVHLRSLRIYDELPPGISPVDRPRITDLGLAKLTGLRTLESLDVCGEGITDASFDSLNHLTQLTSLNLNGTSVTIPALMQFAVRSPATQIRASFPDPTSEIGGFEITLQYSEPSMGLQGDIDDRKVACISAWPAVKRLRMDPMNQVTDDGLRHLADLTNLESLSLHNGHRLTNAALQHLSRLTHLKELSLFACPNITDAGLVHLQFLAALESLELGQTRVTEQGIAKLRQQLPRCQITQ